MIRTLLTWLTGGALDRVMATVEANIAAKTDKEAIKAEIIKTHYATRPDFMRAGGFWLMLIFALPLAFWWSAVLIYSVFWCARCAYPVSWSIAALPAPLDEWAGVIILAIFGVLGVDRLRR
ncbi:hypothetical protein [Yoonia vestfoldensis]|uniref:Uncharacterized protein n=1 Tax=Yoonia vestfoldensis TaxID=245188 RepID=A0A1Y0EHR2_9RHOB|nr:hypothetical protein [Yoonia vestfoldensis]ARU02959.1 hypothetical protein LOKVESSMR4R_03693 [Yoonia vestfoldensis]